MTLERIKLIKERDEAVLKSKTFKQISDTFNLSKCRVLDIGCGYGEYMQRFGVNSVGITTTPEEVEYGNIVERDIRLGNAEALEEVISSDKFDAIWCNNILEHLVSPHSFLVKLKQHSHDKTILILGTPMVPWPSRLMLFKAFRGAIASPHINFFTKKTYELTILYAGWELIENRPYYFKSLYFDRLLTPFAPHLYCTVKNNSKYRYPRKKLNEWQYDQRFANLIKIMQKNKLS